MFVCHHKQENTQKVMIILVFGDGISKYQQKVMRFLSFLK